MGRYLEMAQRALEGQAGIPEARPVKGGQSAVARLRCASTRNETHESKGKSVPTWDAEEIAQFRSRLAELRHRIDNGLLVMRAREEAGKTGHPYPLWLKTWEELLREYEITADRLASITACPIGDCSLFETCTVRPTACPSVGERREESANGSLDRAHV